MADTLTVCVCVIIILGVVLLAYNLGKTSSSGKQKFFYTLNNTSKPILKKDSSKKDVKLFRKHPVLAYQKKASFDTHPANYGDPIRPLGIGASPIPTNYNGNGFQNSGLDKAYYLGEGPYPGKSLNVPVPQGSLKLSSEKYGYPFYYQNKPLISYDYFKPYGPNQPSMQSEIVVADTPFYSKNKIYEFSSPSIVNIPENIIGSEIDYTRSSPVPFISSVNSFAPFPEVQSNWEKVGIIQTTNPDNTTIMNVYRKSIAPLQDLFKYTVQDKNGFVVPLKVNYLEDGDIIDSVPGREKLGKWLFNDYLKDKYVWA